MPIQHGSDDVLRRMGRWTNREQIEKTVAKLREEIPDIALRTTLITGFPGETEDDFDYTPFEGSSRIKAVCFATGRRGIITTGGSSSYYYDDTWELQPYEWEEND